MIIMYKTNGTAKVECLEVLRKDGFVVRDKR